MNLNELLQSSDLRTRVDGNAHQIVRALYLMVNGATRTQGTSSNGQEYAHIPQDVLDVGRGVLQELGILPVFISSRK